MRALIFAWNAEARCKPVSAALVALFFIEGCGARSSLDATLERRGRGGHGAADHGGGGGGVNGAAGHGGSGGAPLPPGCLAELPGPRLVKVELSDRAFCMDATEVTNADYAAWLETDPDPTAQPPSCGWNESFDPWEQVWPAPPDHMDHPVTGVDFCDADAYCRFAGKRLCRAGPGSGAAEEWLTACTRSGEQTFPYGDSFVADACNGVESGGDGTLPVGSLSSCEGGYDGLFDLVGNVTEWVDDCDGTGKSDYCATLGGGWLFQEGISCSTRFAFAREIGGAFTGFRCCRDAEQGASARSRRRAPGDTGSDPG